MQLSTKKTVEKKNLFCIFSKINAISFFCLFVSFVLSSFFISKKFLDVFYVIEYVSLLISLLIIFWLIGYFNKKTKSKLLLIDFYFKKTLFKINKTFNRYFKIKENNFRYYNIQKENVNNICETNKEIYTFSMQTAEQISDCQKILKESESMMDNGVAVMGKLGKSIEVIKNATLDMDKLFEIINQISLKSLVITEIVAKTELLAMNASIEAARAGEKGKGFTVVSEEVETLARTSGKSAKQIRDLLNESSIKVTHIIRNMTERINESESISIAALNSYENIKKKVFDLKNQISLVASESADESKTANDITLQQDKILQEIENSNLKLDEIKNYFEKIEELNATLLKMLSEAEEYYFGARSLKKLLRNQTSELRSTLSHLGF